LKTILVVEDEVAIAQVVRLLLEEEGYAVALAANGHDGWAQLAARRPDLVISDLMMPGLTGSELYDRMQADPALARVPVLIMSAAGDPGLGQSGAYAGFLPTPFELQTLLGLVRRAIGAPAP
jgi:CheY-like chemotaxis protein